MSGWCCRLGIALAKWTGESTRWASEYQSWSSGWRDRAHASGANNMLRKPPRDPKEVGSFAELRQHYSEVWRMLDECKRMKSASDYVSKVRTKEVRGAKEEAKKAQAQTQKKRKITLEESPVNK